MRKEASLPIRLHTDEKQRLQTAAECMGLTVSALVRLLVRSFVEEYDRQGGRIVLPLNWGQTFGTGITEAKKVAEKSVAYPVRSKKKS